MPGATYVMHEMDVNSFHSGIFLSDADMLAPVRFRSEQGFRPMTAYLHESREHPRSWAYYAGPAGIGQYSLKKGPAGALTRLDVHFRDPTEDEMYQDSRDFGEQVIGPCVTDASEEEIERFKNNRTLVFLGNSHYYMGPPRALKYVFLTRVFRGEIPADLAELAAEINGISESGEMIAPQCYHFMHAEGGRMRYMAFKMPEDYDPSKLVPFGFVEAEDGKLTYFPDRERKFQIDLTPDIKNF